MKNLSITGYKRNSPDKNRPYNLIPSSEITMKGVDFPVLGIDLKGNKKVMKPGKDYSFKTDIVIEIPLKDKTFTSKITKFKPFTSRIRKY
jgi:hypothetical protein